MRGHMDRRITPLKRDTSPTWVPPNPCKQALRFSSISTSYGKSINLTFNVLFKRDLQVMVYVHQNDVIFDDSLPF